MSQTQRHLIEKIHDTPTQIVLVTAGAGGQALAALLAVAGASRTLLEAVVPYCQPAFDRFLQQQPQQYVSAKTARRLAGRALVRARRLARQENPLAGLACTATIATDRPKRGGHRAYVATWQPHQLRWYGLRLQKGKRSRRDEERMVSQLILNALARACDIAGWPAPELAKAEYLEEEVYDFAGAATDLHHHEFDYFGIHADGRIHTLDAHPQALLSGAFNPLHEGHLELAQVASEILAQPVAFELAAVNVDKPPLAPATVLARMAQFAGRYPVFASNAPIFVEKARLFPGATFVVGYDTAVRILHPRYYDDSHDKLMSALADIRDLGCRFLVAGRIGDDNQFHHIDELHIPSSFTNLFRPIPEAQFRNDISSTELRQREE